MQLFPLPTPLITTEDNLLDVIIAALENAHLRLEEGDIITIATKIVSITNKLLIKKDQITVTEQAKRYAKITGLSEEFMAISLEESDEVMGATKGALLTKRNNNLMPNAGADQSNAPDDYIVLLPKNPTLFAHQIREQLEAYYQCKIGVIIGDSRVQPLRRGTSGIALGVSGFVPVIDDRGRTDLYGREMKMTRRAIADNLMSAAEILTGEVDEQIPFVLIRDAPITLSDEDLTKTMSIPPDECMYFCVFMGKCKI
ncbi:MAG: coenzyme F420-0:L-glutamate ligase [Asgard group archaeon]|nr:coenzyme F420-0:L-glutamate ligase [Asgard group archaeon]